ncbi:cyclic nucleotide-binding domain-containing protein [Streptomyces sp. 900105755]
MPSRQPGRRIWGDRAYPHLAGDQLARLFEFGVPQNISAGQFVFRLGDDRYDLVVIEEGQLEILREAGPGYPQEVIVTFGPGEFVGELSILTGQFVYLPARAATDGRIYRIPLVATVDLDDVRRRNDGRRDGGRLSGGERGQGRGQVPADGRG